MKNQYTRWQTRRRSLPDQKKSGNGWILGKSCLTLHLTYQIYNLAEEAEQQKAILRLIVPRKCKLSPELKDFLNEHKYVKVIREGLTRMGLYLCIFDEDGEDICGVEVGLYRYFEEFRNLISKYTNKGLSSKILKRKSKFTIPMTTLLNHSDCDGSWNVDECVQLKMELQEIKQVFMNEPPDLSIIELKQDIFKFYGIKPENLFECFIDSDCEFLIDRLIGLCDLAIQENRSIMFQ